MTRKIIAIDLEFPREVEFYGPRPNDKHSTFPKRQKIRGKLRLIASQPTSLSSVEVRFVGCTQLHWRDPLTHSILASRMHAWKTIRKSKHILLKDGTVPSGVTDLGFEITIPGYVCPSYEAEFMKVNYTVSARIIPAGKFAKDLQVERTITIRKTLMPKDIALGTVVGYQVPRSKMKGKRADWLGWEFKVPRWVCINSDIKFEGVLKSLNSQVLVDMIQVDVVQEELYQDDRSDQSRRHLVICPNIPSTYLHPPLEGVIQFEYPLHTKSKRNGSSDGIREPSIQDKNNTFVKRDMLNYSLDSPFLTVQHFIRIIIYTRYTNNEKSPPICIGLPIQITERIDVVHTSPDLLPTYQTVARDGERLPEYYPDLQHQQQQSVEDDEDVDDFDAVEHQCSVDAASNDKRYCNMVVKERRLEDFWLAQ